MHDFPDLPGLSRYRTRAGGDASRPATRVDGVLLPCATKRAATRADALLRDAHRHARHIVKQAQREADAICRLSFASGYADGYAGAVRTCIDSFDHMADLMLAEMREQLDDARHALAARLDSESVCRQLLEELSDDFRQRGDAVAGTVLKVRLPDSAAALAPALRAGLGGARPPAGSVVVETGGACFALEWAGRAFVFEAADAAMRLLPARALPKQLGVDTHMLRRRAIAALAEGLEHELKNAPARTPAAASAPRSEAPAGSPFDQPHVASDGIIARRAAGTRTDTALIAEQARYESKGETE
ncbi:hypothetical protein [Chitinasiproducens palmae]|uniref:Uncharacterized protein n=1 Tax=Chitinasiproducens palmae TaxID=1770053 RepID=A0A1H2PJ04_9BURK|nr:hypothetical protein [Chitinasiproducens palmae]SDV46259.1 hypothetical protein SAMN05216551_101208 [Chitinasiproducens palmae]